MREEFRIHSAIWAFSWTTKRIQSSIFDVYGFELSSLFFRFVQGSMNFRWARTDVKEGGWWNADNFIIFIKTLWIDPKHMQSEKKNWWKNKSVHIQHIFIMYTNTLSHPIWKKKKLYFSSMTQIVRISQYINKEIQTTIDYKSATIVFKERKSIGRGIVSVLKWSILVYKIKSNLLWFQRALQNQTPTHGKTFHSKRFTWTASDSIISTF